MSGEENLDPNAGSESGSDTGSGSKKNFGDSVRDKKESLTERSNGKKEAKQNEAKSDPLNAAKGKGEKAADFGAEKAGAMGAGAKGLASRVGAGAGGAVDKVASADNAAGKTVRAAQKAAEIAKNVSAAAKNIAGAAKGFVAAVVNPATWIALAVVIVVALIVLSTMTAIQVYGKNDSIENCSSNGSVSKVDWPEDGTAEERGAAMMSWLMSNKFEKNGGKALSKEQAAAIAGNFAAESGIDPKVTEGHTMDGASNEAVDAWTKGGPRGLGFAQWTWNPGRAGGLIDLAKSMKMSWYEPEVQFTMIQKEIDGGYGDPLVSAGFFQSGKSIEDLSMIFHDQYEKSADTPVMKARRAEMGKKIAAGSSGGGGYSSAGGDNCRQGGSTVGAECFAVPNKTGLCYPMDPSLYNWVLNTYGGHPFEAKDIPGPDGTPVHAILSGTVVVSEGFGNFTGCPVSTKDAIWPQWTVVIELDEPTNGATTVRYTHFKEASPLKVGSKVKAGDFIGMLGTSGCSTGPHLHIEFTLGSGVDPRSILGTSF